MNDLLRPTINPCASKLNLIQISERHPEVFIGESAGSKSSNLMDQWYRAGYRYVKVRGQDRTICILRFDEIGDQWE